MEFEEGTGDLNLGIRSNDVTIVITKMLSFLGSCIKTEKKGNDIALEV